MKAIRFFRLLLCMLLLATSLLSGCTESSSGQAASESSEDKTASESEPESSLDEESTWKQLPPIAVRIDDQNYLLSDDRFGNELPDEVMERLVYCGAIEEIRELTDERDLENFMARNLLADIGDPIYKYTDPETEEKLLYVYNESGERWFEFDIR